MKSKKLKLTKRCLLISGVLLGLSGIVLSTHHSNQLNNMQKQRKSLISHNNQIYYISLDSPDDYNKNIERIDYLSKEIKRLQNKTEYKTLYPLSFFSFAAGIGLHRYNKRKK